MEQISLFEETKRNNIYSTLGASSHSEYERPRLDLYCTPPEALDRLLKGGAELDENVWECCCGFGHLSERLIEHGYNVKSTDIEDRGYGTGGVDFLQCEGSYNGTILTNPPYKAATEIIEHALDLVEDGCKVFMLLRIQYLEGVKRAKLFDSRQLRTVYVFRKRISCVANGEFEKKYNSAICYAWFEFEKGADCVPVIKWI